MAQSDRAHVLTTVSRMIAEVLGDELLEEVTAASSFKDELEFQSIEFVALAELVQDEYEDIDFVSWLEGMGEQQMLQLTVGDLTDFVVGAAD